MIDTFEVFLSSYRNIAMFFFSSAGFLWIVIRIVLSACEKIAKRANLSQRHEFQAGLFDVQEARHDRMLDLYIETHTRVVESENKALKSELARLRKDQT